MCKAFRTIMWVLLICATSVLSVHARETVIRSRMSKAIAAARHQRDLALVERNARELLGPDETVPFAASAPQAERLASAVHEWTRRGLKGDAQQDAAKVSHAILEESLRHGFDPVFLLAVIERESKFDPAAIGAHGEIGLMQLRPSTAEWIAAKYRLPWHGEKTLRNPVSNIQLGTAYLAFLRGSFKSRGKLYLSAYNMGPAKTREWMRENVTPKVYASEVIENYVRFHEEMQDLM